MRCLAFCSGPFVLAAVLILGCGDEVDPDPVADVPGDEPFAELSDEDRERVCAELDQRVQSEPVFLEGRCRIVGAVRAIMDAQQGAALDTTTACEMYSDECVSAERHYPACGVVFDVGDAGAGVRYVDGPSSCRATVGDFSRCVDARLASFREHAMQSCSELLAGSDEPSASRAICAHIDEHCSLRVVAGESAP